MVFFGTYNHNLDDKSRCTLPSRFREALGTKVYVSRGYDHCLNLYTEEAFNKKVEKYSSFDELSPQERHNARLFFASSSEYIIDKAGRITLTKDHLNRAGIAKEVVLVGNFDHIEIWDKDTYYNMDKYSDENFESNAQFISAQRKGM
jgi:MraZ protein